MRIPVQHEPMQCAANAALGFLMRSNHVYQGFPRYRNEGGRIVLARSGKDRGTTGQLVSDSYVVSREEIDSFGMGRELH